MKSLRAKLTAATLALLAAATLTASDPIPATAQRLQQPATEGGICNRTPIVQEALLQALKDTNKVHPLPQCDGVTSQHLALLTGELSLQWQRIDTLQPQDLQALTNLQELNLADNSIASLPDDLLTEIPLLESIDLSNNDLTEIPEAAFKNNPNLRRIDISENQIASLPKGLLTQATNLLKFEAAANRISKVPDDFAASNPRITHINLSRNKLRALAEGTFAKNNELTRVNLSGNWLPGLPDNIFQHNPNLQTINLSGNRLSRLPVLPPSTKTANLHSNKIKKFPRSLALGRNNFNTLTMDHNPGAPFRFIANLQQVDHNTVRVGLSQKPPLPISVEIAATNVAIHSTTTHFDPGSTYGGEIKITPKEQPATLEQRPTIAVKNISFTLDKTTGILALPGRPLVPEFSLVIETQTPAITTKEGETAVVLLKASKAPQEDISVPYTLGPDQDPSTQDADQEDYNNHSKGQALLKAGQIQTEITIPITADTNNDEPVSETFIVALDPPGPDTPYRLAAQASTEVTIKMGICNRTPAVTAVLLSNLPAPTPTDQSRTCSDITPNHLEILGPRLELKDLDIEELKARDLQGLANVKDLDLSGNKLEEIPKGLLNNMPGLTKVNLARNQLHEIHSQTFQHTPLLEYINLAGNNLTKLPEGLLRNTPALESLILSWNQINQVPTNLLSNTPSLRNLFLDNNHIVATPQLFLKTATNLYFVDLSNNKMEVLPTEFPDSLRILHAQHNLLYSVPDNLPNQLSTLNLEGNNFTEIPDNLPASLQVLHLRDNDIADMASERLAHMPRLSSLNLDRNTGTPFQVQFQMTLIDEYAARVSLSRPSPLPLAVTMTGSHITPIPNRVTFRRGQQEGPIIELRPIQDVDNRSGEGTVAMAATWFINAQAYGIEIVPGPSLTIPIR